MSLISCRDVSLSYESGIVLSGLSFSVEEGDYLCIVGENGSGKSTLIKALLSLKGIRDGNISMGGGLLPTEIGYLPQQNGIQKDFPASVFEVVLSGCLNSRGIRPFYSKKEKERAYTNMKKLGISGLKKRSYQELSGGQQQRVLLARALCAAKKLILLDEPVAGLDVMVSNEFYEAIKMINDEGMSVIMVSHDVEGAVKYASHILHLQNKPLFFGTVDDYMKSDAKKRLFGGGVSD